MATAFGYTGSDVISEYLKLVNDALGDSDSIWKTDNDILTEATKNIDGDDRTIASSLDSYNKKMDSITEDLRGSMNPINNTQSFVNPYLQYQNDQLVNNIQGASGAALQSSATQNKIDNAVAQNTQQNYNDAATKALNEASNNLSISNAQIGQAENVLSNDATPEQDLIAMNQDWATNNLDTQIQIANTIAKTQENDEGWAGPFIRLLTSAFKMGK